MAIVREGVWTQRRVVLVQYERCKYTDTEKNEQMRKENVFVFWNLPTHPGPHSQWPFAPALPGLTWRP